jgi:hypothetical protein
MKMLLAGCALITVMATAHAEDRPLTKEGVIEIVGQMIVTRDQCGMDSIPVKIRYQLAQLESNLDPVDILIAEANAKKFVQRVGKDAWCRMVKETFSN